MKLVKSDVPKKTIIIRVAILFLAVLVAGFGTVGLRGYLVQNRPKEMVLVAKRDIMPYTIVNDSDIEYEECPLGSKTPDSIQDIKQVIGKKTTMIIYKGEQILAQKLADSPLVLGPNESEIGVPIDVVRAVGMRVTPGNQLDLYFLPKEQQQSISQTDQVPPQAQLIAQNAVLIDIVSKSSTSVYSVADLPKDNNANTNSRGNTTDNSPAVAVIKVKNGDVQKIATAIDTGLVYFAKRNS